MSKSFGKYENLYTPMVVQMIGVGEETGSLSDILKNLADFYEEEIDNVTKNMSSVLEPIIMIVIGAAVGFFVYFYDPANVFDDVWNINMKNKNGFTLIDVLIGTALLLIVMIGFFAEFQLFLEFYLSHKGRQ